MATTGCSQWPMEYLVVRPTRIGNGSCHEGTTSGPMVGEVGVNKDLVPWRFIVDLDKKKCTCRGWQLTGLPYVHAIAFIGTRRVELEDFVDHYYSIEMFEAAYATVVPPMPGKEEWEKVEIGFKLLPPKCNRAA